MSTTVRTAAISSPVRRPTRTVHLVHVAITVMIMIIMIMRTPIQFNAILAMFMSVIVLGWVLMDPTLIPHNRAGWANHTAGYIVAVLTPSIVSTIEASMAGAPAQAAGLIGVMLCVGAGCAIHNGRQQWSRR
jgi:hypothetical protein